MSYSAPFPGKEWIMTNEYLGQGGLVIDKSLISNTFPLEYGSDAFKLFKTPQAAKGKIMLENS
jgi:L-iditol 2-dehydrogenase